MQMGISMRETGMTTCDMEKVGFSVKLIGICHYNNGEVYDGDWKEDKKEGNGTLFNRP